MGLRNMLILLGIGFVAVVALGIFVLIESGGPPPDEALKARGLVFSIKDPMNRTIRDLATKVEITRGKETVVLEKATALEWRVKKPVDARADRSAVLSLLDALNTAKLEAEPVEAAEADLAKYGLKEPRIAATFWLGDDAHSFTIGSEAPRKGTSGKMAYLRCKDEARALVVANELVERLDKGVEKLEKPEDTAKWVAAFRDKRVFDRARDPQKAKTLRLVSASRTLELERAEKTWSLRSPVADLADASKVSSLLSKARDLDAEKFASEDPAKLAEYGLDKPRLTCEVKADDGTTMTLLIGKEATEKDHFYAKRGEEPSIFTIKKDFLTDMEPKLDDVRDRKVARFEEDDVTTVEITRGKDTWAVAREGKDKDWRLTKPRDAKASRADAADLVRNLGKLRVARWIDDPKDPAHEQYLKSPEAVLTVLCQAKGKAQPPVKFQFSAIVKKEKEAPKDTEKPKDDKEKKEPEKPKEKEFEEGRYVRRDDQPTLLYVVAGKAPDGAAYEEKDSVEALNSLGKDIDKGYLALLDRDVFNFKEADVTRLTIEREGKQVAVEKKDGDWKVTSPVKLDADKGNVSKILNAMDDLCTEEYFVENPKPEDLGKYGLAGPPLRLTATVEEEEKKDEAKKDDDKEKKDAPKPAKKTYAKTLLVSRKADGKTYGMEQGGTLIFKIGSVEADNLRSEVISTTLGDFAEGDATSLTIAPRGKPEIVIEKPKDKDTWAITKPKQAEADQDAVKKVLDALSDLKGLRCLDYDAQKLADYGLDPAETVVTVKIDKKPDLVLRLGKPVEAEKDTPGSAAVKGDAKQVFLVAKGKVEDIAKSLADLEKKPEPPKKEEPKKEGPKKEEPKKEEPKAKEEGPKAK